MSFISILKRVGQVALGVEHAVAPILDVAVPGFAAIDKIFQDVQWSIQTVEANNPGPTATGPQKAAAVVADFEQGLAITKDILSATGQTISYDENKLQEAIASQVAAYNAFAAVKASIKVVPIRK